MQISYKTKNVDGTYLYFHVLRKYSKSITAIVVKDYDEDRIGFATDVEYTFYDDSFLVYRDAIELTLSQIIAEAL